MIMIVFDEATKIGKYQDFFMEIMIMEKRKLVRHKRTLAP